MRKNSKRALYESIMSKVSKEVKNALNEDTMNYDIHLKLAKYLKSLSKDLSHSIKMLMKLIADGAKSNGDNDDKIEELLYLIFVKGEFMGIKINFKL